MRYGTLLLASILLMSSCIPLSIAPNIKDYKITKGKRFKRALPKKTVFVFEDPKDADEFYNYINTKFGLQDYYVDVQVPFEVKGVPYYFSFYEVERKDKTLHLFPFLVDATLNAALGNEDFETYLTTEDNSFKRKGHWYIAIEVFSDIEKDCLQEKYVNRTAILTYLQGLKKEYLSTHNYHEVVFKN